MFKLTRKILKYTLVVQCIFYFDHNNFFFLWNWHVFYYSDKICCEDISMLKKKNDGNVRENILHFMPVKFMCSCSFQNHIRDCWEWCITGMTLGKTVTGSTKRRLSSNIHFHDNEFLYASSTRCASSGTTHSLKLHDLISWQEESIRLFRDIFLPQKP